LALAEEQRVQPRLRRACKSISAPMRRGVSRPTCWLMRDSASATPAPFAAIVRAPDQARVDQAEQGQVQRLSLLQIAGRRRPVLRPCDLEIGAPAQSMQAIAAASARPGGSRHRLRP
jgi:hypothetical protein